MTKINRESLAIETTKKDGVKYISGGPIYRTSRGVLYHGLSEDLLRSKWFKPLKKNVNLIFTSPPFPLKKKKSYGNLNGDEYINWLAGFADILMNY